MKAYAENSYEEIYIKIYSQPDDDWALYARFTEDSPYLTWKCDLNEVDFNPSIDLRHNIISLIFRRLQDKIKELT